MDKCKKCHDGEMVLKTENEELHYRGKPLVVPLAYHECNSCGFDIVSYELMVERNAIVKEAKRKADGLYSPEGIAAARKRLKLTQAEAADFFGGGRNAFSKYERGEVTQGLALDKLMKIYLKHPIIWHESQELVWSKPTEKKSESSSGKRTVISQPGRLRFA
jgi:HTH-type transcriptional regulator/antitoxin MqsA